MEKVFERLLFVSLVILSSGLLTSISLMAGFHVLMIPAILLALPRYSWRRFPKSGWALLGFSIVLIVSVIANGSMIDKPLKNILKVKYFLIGALSLIPLDVYFNQLLTPQKKERVLRLLMRLLLLGAVLATLSGLVGYYTGYNPLRMASIQTSRNGGVFGMIMTYGHSISWLSVILVAMCVYSDPFKKIISRRWLLCCTAVSLLGLFTSHVRGAWISFLAACMLINRKLTVILMVALAAGVFVSSRINPEFLQNQIVRQGSNEERIGSWLAALKAFEEKPLLGWGYLSFEPHSRELKEKYRLPHPEFGGHAHNDLLEILATSGALGILFFLSWIVLWLKEAYQRKDLGTLFVRSFVMAFLVSGLTQVTVNDGECAFFVMIVYALSSVL